ncbi:MAG: CopG family transcriptional regulator [Ferrovum sp.]|nr:CopG family transcriptional regulator [Ferrovum sp.]
MPQITLYLDDATQLLVEQGAQANGLSKSRWVSEIIRKYADHQWPQDCLSLAGGFPDYPLREDSGTVLSADVTRLGF